MQAPARFTTGSASRLRPSLTSQSSFATGGRGHRHGASVLVAAEGDDHAAFPVPDVLADECEAAGDEPGVVLEPGGEGVESRCMTYWFLIPEKRSASTTP